MYLSLSFLTHMSELSNGCKYPVVLTSCFISISIHLVSCLHDVFFFHNKCYRLIFQHSIFGWRCILNSSPKTIYTCNLGSKVTEHSKHSIARTVKSYSPTIPIDFRWFKFKTITKIFPSYSLYFFQKKLYSNCRLIIIALNKPLYIFKVSNVFGLITNKQHGQINFYNRSQVIQVSSVRDEDVGLLRLDSWCRRPRGGHPVHTTIKLTPQTNLEL